MNAPFPLPTADAQAAPLGLLAMARRARELRARMSALLPGDLFIDTAWDMMIDLVIAHETGERLCVKQLILSSGERPTSALRRIDRLQEAGLLIRRGDPRDHRRILIELTPVGAAAMSALLQHLYGTGEASGDAAPAPRGFSPQGLGGSRARGRGD